MNGIERVKGCCKGQPVIEGSGVRTTEVLGRFLDGQPRARIAEDLSLTEAQIDAAIRFECCKACRCPECAWARELPLTPKGSP